MRFETTNTGSFVPVVVLVLRVFLLVLSWVLERFRFRAALMSFLGAGALFARLWELLSFEPRLPAFSPESVFALRLPLFFSSVRTLS